MLNKQIQICTTKIKPTNIFFEAAHSTKKTSMYMKESVCSEKSKNINGLNSLCFYVHIESEELAVKTRKSDDVNNTLLKFKKKLGNINVL